MGMWEVTVNIIKADAEANKKYKRRKYINICMECGTEYTASYPATKGLCHICRNDHFK